MKFVIGGIFDPVGHQLTLHNLEHALTVNDVPMQMAHDIIASGEIRIPPTVVTKAPSEVVMPLSAFIEHVLPMKLENTPHYTQVDAMMKSANGNSILPSPCLSQAHSSLQILGGRQLVDGRYALRA